MNTGRDESYRVLVVDDQPITLAMMAETLTQFGYTVFTAENGADALLRAQQQLPHAVLLDVVMPGMSGYEVCRKLKDHPLTASIPVLMLTALNDTESRLAGIGAGADDFLSKPIDAQEIQLRVRNACRLNQFYNQVRDALDDLRNLEQLRDGMVHMIAHDMRNPLMVINIALNMLGRRAGTTLKESDQSLLNNGLQMCTRLNDMISNMLLLSRMESKSLPLNRVPTRFDQMLERILGAIPRADRVERGIVPENTLSVDVDLIERVLANLVQNALLYSPESCYVRVSAVDDNAGWRVTVTDRGHGVPPERRGQIFEKFVRNESSMEKRGFGLGLAFCRCAIEAHGGQIGVHDNPEGGSIFWFTLPAPQTNIAV